MLKPEEKDQIKTLMEKLTEAQLEVEALWNILFPSMEFGLCSECLPGHKLQAFRHAVN